MTSIDSSSMSNWRTLSASAVSGMPAIPVLGTPGLSNAIVGGGVSIRRTVIRDVPSQRAPMGVSSGTGISKGAWSGLDPSGSDPRRRRRRHSPNRNTDNRATDVRPGSATSIADRSTAAISAVHHNGPLSYASTSAPAINSSIATTTVMNPPTAIGPDPMVERRTYPGAQCCYTLHRGRTGDFCLLN